MSAKRDAELPGDNPDIDLYCVSCGYNLRGLAGSLRRCPECGTDNDVHRITWQEQLSIKRELKALDVQLPHLAFTFVILCVAVLYLVFGQLRSTMSPWLILIACAAAATLAMRVVRFRSSCRGQRGWFRAMVLYVVVAMILCGAAAAPFFAATLVVVNSPRILADPKMLFLVGGAIVICVVVVELVLMFLFGLRLLPQLKATVHDLQRAAAIENIRKGRCKQN